MSDSVSILYFVIFIILITTAIIEGHGQTCLRNTNLEDRIDKAKASAFHQASHIFLSP